MKKFLLAMAGLALACTASADWSTTVNDPVKLFPTGTSSYATDTRASSDGTMWSYIYYPNTKYAEDEYETDKVIYEYRLQHYDKQGNPEFGELGMLVSDYSNWSYTVVDNLLHVDREGNAILAVSDCRNSSDHKKSYTAYKVSPTGEMLWGEDGVALTDPMNPSGLLAWMDICELDDGSFVFAWMDMAEDNSTHVYMQRLNKAGEPQWDLNKVAMTSEVTGYPNLVPSEDNTFIMVYGRTASTILYARKMDFEAESVWGKDVRIYRGGWGQIPLQVLLSVVPSGDGGVLVSWTDDRAATMVESAYLSYVTSDGELGFAGASDEADVKLSYDGWRCFNLKACPAADGSGFYAVWRRTDGNQHFQGIQAQKVSKDGTLLWSDNGLEIEPTIDSSWGYTSCQPTSDGGLCVFYEEYRGWTDQQCFAYRVDAEGNEVWTGSIPLSLEGRGASNLESQEFGKTGQWLLQWTDGGTGGEDNKDTYFVTRFNENGSFGDPSTSVSIIESGAETLRFNGTAICGNMADGTEVTVYSIDGVSIATSVFSAGKASVSLPAGLYIAYVQGKAVKFVVK